MFNQCHVRLTDISFAQNGRNIFQQVNMNIPRGKIVGIMGPSGSGKTTLLRLIGGQLRPASGRVLVDDQDIHALPLQALYTARRNMGLLFQNNALFTDLSVFDNVAFPLREHSGLPESMIRDIVLMKLEAVGLRGASQFMPHVLSGGMARRVALARAIAFDPQLMLYDEPFTGQDPISMGVLVRLIQRLNHLLGLTSIIVSHDVQETAAIADYLYVIAQGQIIGEGSPDALLVSEDPRVHQFMHGEADGMVPFHFPARRFSEELLHEHE